MSRKISISSYHNSLQKRIFDLIFALVSLTIMTISLPMIAFLIKVTSSGPVFFKQNRTGKKGKVFSMFKYRTMRLGSDKILHKYRNLNEADGPVFKIYNDPRFTSAGKFLSRTGLDELPQIINVLKGEMSIVGPRPLPVKEANKLSKTEKVRELINPGITSSWIVEGAHRLKFKKWMELDKEYLKNASLKTDLIIIFNTAKVIFITLAKQLI